MERRGVDIWDVILLVAGLSILFWALLKAIGIIHSPVWVEMIPYIGAGTAVIGIVYNIGKVKKGIEETDKKVDRILSINERFSRLEPKHNLVMCGKMRH